MVLTVSFVLSPVTGLFCHRRRRNCFRQLDASVGASGPHDFAVRIGVARLASPPRPSHPAPNVRDDREAPLLWGQDARMIVLIWGFRQCRAPAADWHDGQFAHNAHARSARRANQLPDGLGSPAMPFISLALDLENFERHLVQLRSIGNFLA
jgi:hypothetical protein